MDLTTLASVKNYLQVADNNSDTILADLITACSQYFFTLASLAPFASTLFTEKYNGQGGQILVTNNNPITGVTSLTIDKLTIPLSPDGIAYGYVFSQTAIMLIGWYFNRGFKNITLVYTAGSATVPADVEMAVRMMAGLTYRQRKNVGALSETINGAVVAFDKIDVPKFSQGVIERYKNRFPAIG